MYFYIIYYYILLHIIHLYIFWNIKVNTNCIVICHATIDLSFNSYPMILYWETCLRKKLNHSQKYKQKIRGGKKKSITCLKVILIGREIAITTVMWVIAASLSWAIWYVLSYITVTYKLIQSTFRDLWSYFGIANFHTTEQHFTARSLSAPNISARNVFISLDVKNVYF